MRTQRGSLEHGAHIIVGTPGRVKAFLEEKLLDLSHVNSLVLDEADRMLDMGFMDDVQSILGKTPKNRQTLLFSATFPESILDLSRHIQKDPLNVDVTTHESAPDIAQEFLAVEADAKLSLLPRILDRHSDDSCIIFCNMKSTCTEVSEHLNKLGFHTLDIHGDLEQKERTETLILFGNGSCRILVATDLAARGLDIKALPLVVNYDFPNTPEIYRHRIGRTGRAGESGRAITLITEENRQALGDLEAYLGHSVSTDDAAIPTSDNPRRHPEMVTLVIEGGKKQKLRPGDILGALTKDVGLSGDSIGKIDILERVTYVAVKHSEEDTALQGLRNGGIKGKSFRVWVV